MQTRYPEIEIVKRDAGLWRYHIEGADVGPHMPTKDEAFAGLDQYAADYGVAPKTDLHRVRDAAPDLLAACEQLMQVLGSDTDDPAFDWVHAAIAQARGA